MHSEFLLLYCHMHRKTGKTDCLGSLTVIVRLARGPRNTGFTVQSNLKYKSLAMFILNVNQNSQTNLKTSPAGQVL